MFGRLTVKILACLFIQMLELVVKNGSEEDQILDFVGKFFLLDFKKVEDAGIFTKLPTLIIDKNDHVAGLALILRKGFKK